MCSKFLQLCFLSLTLPCFLLGQSEVVQALKDEQKVLTGYYLLPSTMRMINLQHDPEFDKLIRPIRKISVLSMRTDKYNSEDLRNSASQIISEEGYDTYAEVDGPDHTIFVLGNPEKDFTCVLAYTNEQCLISEIQGKIDVYQLTQLYDRVVNDTTAQGNSAAIFDGNFINIFDLIIDDNDFKKKKEKRDKEWRERQKRKREGIEVVDSIGLKTAS